MSEIIITGFLFYWLLVSARVVGNTPVNISESQIKGTFFTLGVLAYFFGLRHAIDPDHLATIDNSTRKLIQEGKPAQFTGLFFSLGHSTIVILLAVSLMVATRFIVSNISILENMGSVLGTLISGGFLYIIGSLNFVILLEIYQIYNQYTMNKNTDEKKLQDLLLKRGFMSRFFGKLFKVVDKQHYMYPIGVLFGLGFDTASETALLAISAAAAGIFLKLPLWNLLVFPLLFTAGMSLIDTTDGFYMSGAYGWAFSGNPIRKLWYNLTMTTISILVAYLIGTLEFLGVVQAEFNFSGPFWELITIINGDRWWSSIGMIIIGTFATAWLVSFIIYKVKISKFEH
ncbi:HoxN/HupN/NixA family nickel/cobalt transporter [Sulfolobus islandicus]